ncbi:MAG: hypothetical protein KKH41_05625 [Candidatus Thermoplasmatota archaeon]|nr:hypothetical protein [Euryarchaeota archaeon]MBU4070630.1 hypothetical protein [Candidatus Thermoplasmatota archaeon]MBU4143985.1 hypothetical protein [Candidatus Thermoplasmatota archaeon]MBU4592047.1 hypothetical protein [Candidatus Thermoplasmatota archaeon]
MKSMPEVVRDKGPEGQGSIVFRQNLEYPRAPGHITYYPPEPSDDMKKQMKRDRGGGLAVYIIGFVIVLLGFIIAMEFSDAIEVYSLLIPVVLILGLVSAIMFLYTNNVALAKLSRAMPMILMICLLLMYIFSIITTVMELTQLGENATEAAVSDAFDDLLNSIINPAFFLMSAGLMTCRAGGTMLWTSTKLMNQFIPGMIIIENPAMAAPQATVQPAVQPPVAKSEKEDAMLCEHCEKPLEYIEEYQRHYCYSCKEYAPKDA